MNTEAAETMSTEPADVVWWKTRTDQGICMDGCRGNDPARGCVGKHAVVGACSVVTKDVADYALWSGTLQKS